MGSKRFSKIAVALLVALSSTFLPSTHQVLAAPTQKKAYMNIEAPSNNQSLTTNAKVSGWAITDSGSNKVEVFVDNSKVGEATKGIARPYIKFCYPSYKDSLNSGYSYDLNIDNLINGNHSLTVKVTGANGLVIQKTISIAVNKPVTLPPKMNIETPVSDSTLNGDVKVAGWALNESGIKEVNISLDGKMQGAATLAKRTYIQSIYPLYNNINNGYTYTIPAKSLAVGTHTLLVQAIGSNGTKKEKSIKFKFNGTSTGTGTTITPAPTPTTPSAPSTTTPTPAPTTPTQTPTKKVRKFAIDAGHGVPIDAGATGFRQEDDMTLEVAELVTKKLRAAGQIVYEARPKSATSVIDALQQRSDVANNNNVDMFVSIHFNKFDGTANGTEVFTKTDEGAKVASEVLKNITGLGYRNRGIKDANFYVLVHTNAPSMLIEGCFLDNEKDMKLYDKEKMADAIVKGLLTY